ARRRHEDQRTGAGGRRCRQLEDRLRRDRVPEPDGVFEPERVREGEEPGRRVSDGVAGAGAVAQAETREARRDRAVAGTGERLAALRPEPAREPEPVGDDDGVATPRFEVVDRLATEPQPELTEPRHRPAGTNGARR